MVDKMHGEEGNELKKLIIQLKSAYRKFKTYTYYDNYGAVNRAKIANFENQESWDSMDDFFEELAIELKDERKREKLLKILPQKINVLCYPKSIKLNLTMNLLWEISLKTVMKLKS